MLACTSQLCCCTNRHKRVYINGWIYLDIRTASDNCFIFQDRSIVDTYFLFSAEMKVSIANAFTLCLGFLPIAITSPISNNVALVPRAPIHRQTCSGDYGGTSIGVLVCCDIDFNHNNDMTLKLSVRDSKGDSSAVYGWCVVTDDKKKTYHVPASKLRNSQGVGSTVSQAGIQFSLPTGTRIQYVSARGCVDKVIDQCADWAGRETVNPY
ncbi:hypothetical protein CC80DRAFT_157107 [Byssothecium circinans]|uniref:Uncharacterized protein n=1 Tax=Byssothecium circinans TaxID=147558 RepID=A0A6A5UMB9_9PLEO|nr:hypothetical protein CC80DRAFT_157107 [Byssothecium circinans]